MIGCMTAFFLAACINENDTLPYAATETKGNSIILDVSSPAQPTSRAEAIGIEAALDHIDVLIFNTSVGEEQVYHERVQVSNNNTLNAITLTKPREEFVENQPYKVYLIANSNHEATRFKTLANLDALKAMTQEDKNIHLTGLKNLNDVPQTFLMDGIAHRKNQTSTDVVLNNNGQTDDTVLEVVLRRAAAKVEVKIKKGDKVTFGTSMPGGAGYYLRNMPYTTSVISGVDAEAELYTPMIAAPTYFKWGSEEIVVTTYVYAHSWADESVFEKDVRLVVNIPLTYKEYEDGGEIVRESNYYQVPVVNQTKKLERNTYYVVTATVNAPGATNPSEATALEEVKYSVEEWKEETINVGGESNRPVFLHVNKEEMAMYNMTDDNTTLHFSSSSEVTATVERAYYVNKFGIETDVDNSILNQINVTADDGLSGNIAVHSPVPTNNAIRYVVLKITNIDSATPCMVTIAQHPLEYITNIQSWYSYRDDFKSNNSQPTTYEYKGDRITGVGYEREWSWSSGYGPYEYVYKQSYNGGFWHSKVADTPNEDGKSRISYYYWDDNNSNTPQTRSAENNGNARMYHVRITASSGDYTLGKPRLTNEGYTDPGTDNAKLVSPSFMIASRLGFLNTGNISLTADYAQEVVKNHCANYVEVYKDKDGKKVKLDDWRLPTKAELEIIMKFQGEENQDADAIDYLLNAEYYWSASGRINNTKSSSSGTSIRCIRDAYDDSTVNQ